MTILLSLEEPALRRWFDSQASPALKMHLWSIVSQYELNSLTLEELIRRVSWFMKSNPTSLETFRTFLPIGYDLVFVTQADRVELAVSISPHSASVYDLHGIYDGYPTCSEDLRALLEKDSDEDVWQKMTTFKPPVTECVLQLLQWELDRNQDNPTYRRKCLQHMRRFARAQGVLPLSFYLRGVVREGEHPITGGGFADIWRGRMGRKAVCLKMLRIFTTESAKAKVIQEFCHEALVWKQLDHPNVLPFLGVSKDLFAPSFCLISPFMENGNILAYLERHPDHDRLACLEQITEGLKYLHSQSPKIIHGDIRGANILVKDNLQCCLADFGLATVSETQPLASSSAALRGATRWLGPELMDTREFADQDIEPTTRDIYAFACTVVEIYTGKPPFAQHRLDATVITDVMKGLRPERPLEPPLPDELWDVVNQCWTELPEERPPIEEVSERIRSIRAAQVLRALSTLEYEEPSWVDMVGDWLDGQSLSSGESARSSRHQRKTKVFDWSNDMTFVGTDGVSLRRRPAAKRRTTTGEWKKSLLEEDMKLATSPSDDQSSVFSPGAEVSSPIAEPSKDESGNADLLPPKPAFISSHARTVSSGSASSSSSRRWGWMPGRSFSTASMSSSATGPSDISRSSSQVASPAMTQSSPLATFSASVFQDEPGVINEDDTVKLHQNASMSRRKPGRHTRKMSHILPDEPKQDKSNLHDPTWKLLPEILRRQGLDPDAWRDYVMLIVFGPHSNRKVKYMRDDDKALQVFYSLKDRGLNPRCELKNIREMPSPVAQAQKRNAENKLSTTMKHTHSQSEPLAQPHGKREPKARPKIHDRKLSLPDPVTTYAVAVYPHEAEKDGEIDVAVGDRFIVLSALTSKWLVQTDLTGTSEDQEAYEGRAPAACFLQLSAPAIRASELARARTGRPGDLSAKAVLPILPQSIVSPGFPSTALRDFCGMLGEEELTIQKGENVLVYKKHDKWSYVIKEGTGERGWVPYWLISSYDRPGVDEP